MKKLTIDQLVVLETLRDRELCQNGVPRKVSRTLEQSLRMGIPESHHNWLHRPMSLDELPRVPYEPEDW
jgi:hypothetical protein